MTVHCPKCGFDSADSENCSKCGVNFVGYQNFLKHQAYNNPAMQKTPHPNLGPAMPNSNLSIHGLDFLNSASTVFVKQHEDALRIVTGWQTLNNYSIQDENGQILASMAERDVGGLSFFSRQFFRARRTLNIDIYDTAGRPLAELHRPFYWFFSDLFIRPLGAPLSRGRVENKLSFWMPKYTLYDLNGAIFGTLKCPILGADNISGAIVGNRNYHLYDRRDQDTGASILRSWNGLMRIFTDEDAYAVNFAPNMTVAQKLVLLSAAITIDFDSYESDKNLIGPAESLIGAAVSSNFSDNNN